MLIKLHHRIICKTSVKIAIERLLKYDCRSVNFRRGAQYYSACNNKQYRIDLINFSPYQFETKRSRSVKILFAIFAIRSYVSVIWIKYVWFVRNRLYEFRNNYASRRCRNQTGKIRERHFILLAARNFQLRTVKL